MSRRVAIERVTREFDSGRFLETLGRRVAYRTESKKPADGRPLDWNVLHDYLNMEIDPELREMEFSNIEVMENPSKDGDWPFLVASRIEDNSLPTVLLYGHGDVVDGEAENWMEGLDPWVLSPGEVIGKNADRVYGRGTADNKGQHSAVLSGLSAALAARGGKLGFNVKVLIEMGEEAGSPGIDEFCEAHKGLLSADVFIASDGPRLAVDRPTLFMGTRGGMNFELEHQLREPDEFHHSGNHGGLLENPAIRLIHALATLTGPNGEIAVPEWRPSEIPEAIREALADCEVEFGEDGPDIDQNWGEPGLSPSEKVFGWNSFEVLGLECGKRPPSNAIPPLARAYLQLRFVAGCDDGEFIPGLKKHLKRHGFADIKIARRETAYWKATRLLPDHPWVQWAACSLERTTGKKPGLLPNLGGSLPISAFSDVLGLPVIFVPHSYVSCRQHGPNEHALKSILREGLQIMAGLFWDLGEGDVPSGQPEVIESLAGQSNLHMDEATVR